MFAGVNPARGIVFNCIWRHSVRCAQVPIVLACAGDDYKVPWLLPLALSVNQSNCAFPITVHDMRTHMHTYLIVVLIAYFITTCQFSWQRREVSGLEIRACFFSQLS